VVKNLKSATSKDSVFAENSQNVPKESASLEKEIWTTEENNLLARAVLKFPVGTRNRWEKIQEFIGGTKTVKQVIARTKNSLKVDASMTQEDQFLKWQREKKTLKKETDLSGGSENYESLALQQQSQPTVTDPVAEKVQQTKIETPKQDKEADAKVWTNEEQKALEDALKTYPHSLGKERWTKVAECIPGKTKKDCFDRYKFLVEAVKQAKK